MSYRPADLFDPLLLNSFRNQSIPQNGGFKLKNPLANFSLASFVLNYLIPFLLILFIVLVVKLKWDKKHKKITTELPL